MNGAQVKSVRMERGQGGNEIREILDSIRRIVRLLRVSSREAEREVGLSGAQLFVLRTLSEHKFLSVNELAERTHTHQSSVSVVVQVLVDKGLITRSKAADDGRRLELSLAAAAKSLIRKAPDAAQGKLIGAITSLAPAARKQLSSSLIRLIEEAGLADEEAEMIFEDTAQAKKSKKKK